MRLPDRHRPTGLSNRRLKPGLDLPTAFIDELKGIDPNLHFVWHRFRVIYDDVMNQYTGSLEEPRFSINERFGVELWGWPLLDTEEQPIPDNKWHIWRLHQHGWSHIINIESRNPEYLRLVIQKIARADMLSKMSHKERMKFLQDEQDKLEADKIAAGEALWKDVQKENNKLMRQVAENFASGNTRPTNPTKDVITSFEGQTNRSRIVRPLDDREGGLILPDDWGRR